MKYRLSKTAASDLIRIYQYGLKRFGEQQAKNTTNTYLIVLSVFALVLFPLKLLSTSRWDIADVYVAWMLSTSKSKQVKCLS